MAYLQPTRRSSSHGTLGWGSATGAHHISRTLHWHRPLQTLDGNTLLLTSLGPPESMLKKTTGTGDVGLFSIGPVCSTNTLSFPFRQKTGWNKSSCAGLLPSNRSEEVDLRDDRSWLPSYLHSTCGIISMSESDGLSGSGYSTLSNDNWQRYYPLTTCSSRRLPTQESDGAMPKQLTAGLLNCSDNASIEASVTTSCHTPDDGGCTAQHIQTVASIPLQNATTEPHQEVLSFRRHKRSFAVPKIHTSSALPVSNTGTTEGSTRNPTIIGMGSEHGPNYANNEGAVARITTEEREAELEVTLPQSSTSQRELFGSKSETAGPHNLSSSLPEEGRQITRPCHRRLKLKVSRGALARERRHMGRFRRDFSDCRCPVSRQVCRDIDCGSLREGLKRCERDGTLMGSSALTPPAMAFSYRRWGMYFPETQSEIQSLFSSESCVNSKVLWRLNRRYPDLRARLADAQLQSTEWLTSKSVETNEVGQSQEKASPDHNQQLRPKRFRTRVSKWMRGAKQSIKGACIGSKGRK